MCKRNVDIRKIPLSSCKITDTNESQITRNFLLFIWKTRIVWPSHNVHECHDLLHTYMCVSPTEDLFVADSAKGAVLLHISASSERQECGDETGILKKRTKRQILK